MLMRYNHGDVLQLLPVMHNDDSQSFMLTATFFYNQARMVWDIGDTLAQAYQIEKRKQKEHRIGTFGHVRLCGAKNLRTGQVGIVKFGVTLKRKISDYYRENGWRMDSIGQEEYQYHPEIHVSIITETLRNIGVHSYDKSSVGYCGFPYESIDPTSFSSLNIDDFISNHGLQRHWHTIDSETDGLLSAVRANKRNETLEKIGI